MYFWIHHPHYDDTTNWFHVWQQKYLIYFSCISSWSCFWKQLKPWLKKHTQECWELTVAVRQALSTFRERFLFEKKSLKTNRAPPPCYTCFKEKITKISIIQFIPWSGMSLLWFLAIFHLRIFFLPRKLIVSTSKLPKQIIWVEQVFHALSFEYRVWGVLGSSQRVLFKATFLRNNDLSHP